MPVGETLQAALLGLVQGLTEFLPISSSGHLLVVPWLLGWTSPLLNSLTFDVALHLGTLGAVIVYFRREWQALGRALLTPTPHRTAEIAAQRRLAWLLVLGSVPAGLAGLLMDRSRAAGHAPGFADLAIAAMAGVHDLTVLTRNMRHFAPLDIPAHDPFESLPG